LQRRFECRVGVWRSKSLDVGFREAPMTKPNLNYKRTPLISHRRLKEILPELVKQVYA
jgi:hypothetical protein